MSWIGLDVGGANLKAADGRGFAAVRPFALWRAPGRLTDELRALFAEAPSFIRLAVTMTGELCDCFASQAEGVRAIVNAAVAAAEGRDVLVYDKLGRFLPPVQALDKKTSFLAAASNWHALAAFALRFAPNESALLVDVGSTTVDVIPYTAKGVAAIAKSDTERLLVSELVYTGVERTPVAAIVSHLPWFCREIPCASELFATSADAYVILGDLPEDPANRDTADEHPRTRMAARARLARMVCRDAAHFTDNDARLAAEAVRDAQVELLVEAIEAVARRQEAIQKVILSGHGEFLARRVVARASWGKSPPEVVSLTASLGPVVSRCAPAHALAVLAEERLGSEPAR